MKKHLQTLNKHNIRAPLVREFLEKGLKNASLGAIETEIQRLETQSSILQTMALEISTTGGSQE